LAVFEITRQLEKARSLSSLIPCHRCSLPACDYRRATYRQPLPRIEDCHGLHVKPTQTKIVEPPPPSILDRNAQYSIHPKALKKWSRQHLRMVVREDGSVEARFRYEGTTCMNLGHPLEFDYFITLNSPEANYLIRQAKCAPADGDAGHQKMCAYLNDPDSLLRSIAEEKPLLGQPLNDVLGWIRNYNPAGCLCERESRMHKWGLALEVLHYALVEREASGESLN
jgi:hypothetical protein